MRRKKTHEEFVFEVFNLVNNEYTVLGEYIDSQTHILMRHEICKCEYSVVPNKFLQGKRCPQCFRCFKKTTDQFKQEVYNLVNNEYEVLSEYTGANNKIKMIHNVCKHEYDVTPDKFLHGRRCPKCNGTKLKKQEEFLKEIIEMYGDDYEIIGRYVNGCTNILVKHNICQYTYETRPTDLLRGHQCPKCFRFFKKTTEEFAQEVKLLDNGDYELQSEYINAHTNVDILHLKCNRIFSTTPNVFLSGSRCPYCKMSKGEVQIEAWLKENEKNFSVQYRITNCKNKLPLPFDFAVFNNENKLLCLIEYDGEQHFNPINFGGKKDKGASSYKLAKKRDEIKNNYCESYRIPLLRIPYWDFDNINIIMNDYLNKLEKVI